MYFVFLYKKSVQELTFYTFSYIPLPPIISPENVSAGWVCCVYVSKTANINFTTFKDPVHVFLYK